jgi:hypothetical protein
MSLKIPFENWSQISVLKIKWQLNYFYQQFSNSSELRRD